MSKRFILILFILVSTFAIAPKATAQCAMCSLNAEQSVKNGNTQGKGLNSGIIYLLAIPYVLMMGLGVIWYKNYRKKANANREYFN